MDDKSNTCYHQQHDTGERVDEESKGDIKCADVDPGENVARQRGSEVAR